MCFCGSGGVGGGSGCGVDISDEGGGVDGSAGNNGVGDGGERIMYRNSGGGGSVAYWSVGGGLCRSGWYSAFGWGFRGGGSRGSGTGGGVCG